MKAQASESNPLNSLSELRTYDAGIMQSTAHRLLKKFTDDCLRSHDLSTMQWFVIGIIHDTGDDGMTMTQISKTMDTNVPYITNMLNKLENKGIIVRTSAERKDSRTKVAKINPLYANQIKLIEDDLRRKMRETIYSNVTPKELRTYMQVLMKFNHALSDYQ